MLLFILCFDLFPSSPDKLKNSNHQPNKKPKGRGACSCFFFVFMSIMVLVVGVLIALDFHCQSNTKDKLCVSHWQPVRKEAVSFISQSKASLLKIYDQNIRPLFK